MSAPGGRLGGCSQGGVDSPQKKNSQCRSDSGGRSKPSSRAPRSAASSRSASISMEAPSGQRRTSLRTAAKRSRPMRRPTSLAAASFHACPSPRPLALRRHMSNSSAKPLEDSFNSAAPVIFGGRTRYLKRPLSTVRIHLSTSSSDHSQSGRIAEKLTSGRSTQHSERKDDNALDICVTCSNEFMECSRSVAVGDTVDRTMVLWFASVKQERSTCVKRLAR
mmetsp:Transcript_45271/g.105660  ORF Transcript_45271/g.105660 Transcript_45271/m.105660 type:complete len:221 (+) Transcript_45271:163-825(+)